MLVLENALVTRRNWVVIPDRRRRRRFVSLRRGVVYKVTFVYIISCSLYDDGQLIFCFMLGI